VGAVYDEFVRELADWKRRYADRPKEEMIRLFLLALEREEIVSVAYRESLMATRLRAMPLAAEVQELIRHALLWAWKDEEMHAIYIRGAILKLGNRLLASQALARQAAGAVGGWATSVQQHVRWRDAPLSRTLSSAIAGAGIALGQVPADVRRFLRYGPFRDFCLFNVDAEKTAELCWARIAELAPGRPELPAETVQDFQRIRDDEERHARIFEIIAAALDPSDHLAAGETLETLAARIGAVGEFFLPPARQGVSALENPLGRGDLVCVLHGDRLEDKLPLFRRLLRETGLAERLRQRASSLGKTPAELRVAVKPTFMLGYHRKDPSPVTDPVLVADLAHWLREQGCGDVAVVEARNIYDRFYANRTVHDVARYFGFTSPHYRVVDLTEEQVPHCFGRGMAQYTVGRTWQEADFRISFGKMRSHPVEVVYLTLGTLEGIGARCEEFLFAERQAHRETALMMLLSDCPPHFGLLDAFEQVPDGLVGMMGCPRPKTPRRLYGGADALAVDFVAARHMGVADPKSSQLLRTACHWFGEPPEPIRVIGHDAPLPRWRGPYHTELSILLSILAYPVYEHGSGRGTLFVPEMDEKAFPPLARVGSLLRTGRRGIQALLGLRHAP
jgi:hypothetical protein